MSASRRAIGAADRSAPAPRAASRAAVSSSIATRQRSGRSAGLGGEAKSRVSALATSARRARGVGPGRQRRPRRARGWRWWRAPPGPRPGRRRCSPPSPLVASTRETSTRVSAYPARRRTRPTDSAGLQGAVAERRAQRVAGLGELADGHRLAAVAVRERGGGLLDEPEGIVDAGDQVAVRERLVRARRGSALPRARRCAGEVAAVHRGDVAGLQRAQSGRVVPVVEVAAEALEAAHRRQGGLEAVHHVEEAQPAEVPGGDHRQQVEADVGRRRAMRQDGPGILLEVVGRQEGVVVARRRTRRSARSGARSSGGRRRPRGRAAAGATGAGGRLTQRATAGERLQSRRNGAATARLLGRSRSTSAPAAAARTSAPPMRRYTPPMSRERSDLVCAAVVHSSSRRRVTYRRTSVRAIASPMSHAWWARKVMASAICDAEIVKVRPTLRKWVRLEMPAPLRNDLVEYGKERRQRDGGEDERGPHEREAVREQPADDEGEHGGGRRQGPAEVVGDLPQADERDPGRPRPRAGVAPDYPGEELPVAPRPAVLAPGRDLVVGGELLEELDVGDEPRAREDPLEEVVAQERVLGDAILEGGGERGHVVDALAGVRALAEEVLVDVGGRGRVGIDPGRAGEDPLEERAVAIRGDRGRDPGLQDRVAVHHAARARVEDRPVQRMGHRADEAIDRAARQARVRVEGDDVADAGGHRGRRARQRLERRRRRCRSGAG